MRLRDAIADSIGSVLGRRRFARLARFLWLRSRLDVRNDMQQNGEKIVQLAVLRLVLKAGSGTIFDIGSNVGQWTLSLLGIAQRLGLPTSRLNLHLFEPAPETADVLERALRHASPNVSVVVNRVAVAEADGSRDFHIVGRTAGTNSLFQPTEPCSTIQVPCISLDQYCAEKGITCVDYCKIDAEGADYEVLRGALRSLRSGVLKRVQFEYNHRWIGARRYLRDVFEIGCLLGMELGKITPKGIEKYERWDPELECFQEGNYLLARDLEGIGVTVFPWWNEFG